MSATNPRRVLVTGSSGFLGSHVAARLRSEGFEVFGTDRRGRYPLDLRDSPRVRQLFEEHRFCEVYHFAAYGVRNDQADPAELVSVSTLAATNLARAALATGVERFVYMGSGFEYGLRETSIDEAVPIEPCNSYGAVKAAGSLLLEYFQRCEGLPLITLRAFSVYWPGELPPRIVHWVCRQAFQDKPLCLTQGTQVRDYLYVDDLVTGVMAARNWGVPGGVYNLGGGPSQAMTVRQVVENIVEAAGRPLTLCQFGAIAPLRPEPARLVADISRAQTELGWCPRIALAEGLAKTVEWNWSHADWSMRNDR